MEVYYSHNPKIMRSEGMINIDKELFRKTEGKLYRYYSKDKHEKSLKEKLNLLNNQIEAINKELRECDINLEPESKRTRKSYFKIKMVLCGKKLFRYYNRIYWRKGIKKEPFI